jgi:multiple inositol-polyphosphate phosphatase/2,3-bisphosphoglycerate 3-phosphatase
LEVDGFLSKGGQREVYEIGKRFDKRYGEIFGVEYSPSMFVIETTQSPRTSMSGNVFGYAMFGEDEGSVGPFRYQPIFSKTNSKGSEYTLRFFDECQNYVKQKRDPIHSEDENAFMEKYFEDIAQNINQKIGANPHFKVGKKNVTLFFDLCSFDYTINEDMDRFCSLFTNEEIEMIELFYDISSYNTRGYGWKFSYDISCPLVSEIISLFDKKINGTEPTNAYLRFGHAETLLPLIARLGLFKDPFSLKWNTSQKNFSQRKWRNSQMSSFSSNIAFVLYKCESDYKVEVLHNEKQISFEECNNQIFCPYDQFKKLLSFVNDCNFNMMCGSNIDTLMVCDQQNNSSISISIGSIYISSFIFIIMITIIIGLMIHIRHSSVSYE